MNKSLQRIAVFTIVFLATSSCASLGIAKNEGGKPLPKAEASAIAILADSCPFSPPDQAESLGLAGIVVQAFAPAVIGFGYDLVVKSLEERVDALTASTTAVAQGTLYRQGSTKDEVLFSPKPKCLVLIRGGFDLKPGDTPPSNPGDWSSDNRELVDDALKSAGLKSKLVSAPELYAEFAITYPTKATFANQPILGKDDKPLKGLDGKELEMKQPLRVPVGLTLRPVKVMYRKSGAKRNPDPVKQLVFQIDLKAKTLKDSKWDYMTLVEGTFDLGLVKIGDNVPVSVLEAKTAASGTMVPPVRIPPHREHSF